MQSEKNLNQDVEVADCAIIYDAETGDIVGSHTLGAVGQHAEEGRRRFESLLRHQVEILEKRHGRKLAIHRSPELTKLTSLHHRVDVATGRLIEHAQRTRRIKVE